jgi:hypothetical protein
MTQATDKINEEQKQKTKNKDIKGRKKRWKKESKKIKKGKCGLSLNPVHKNILTRPFQKYPIKQSMIHDRLYD